MKTIFFGASPFVIPLIKVLQDNYDLQTVITTETALEDAVPQYCHKENISFISVTSLKDQGILDKIQAFDAPFAVLADFRLIIKQNVLDIFPQGIINIHPSLLPEYRGPTPGVSALLDRREETGVTIMLLDPEVDHGPIIAQEKAVIEPTDTAISLYERLFEQGARLLEENLPQYLDGSLKPITQDHTRATFTKMLTRESGFISMDTPPSALQLDAMIRAYYPWPGVWTKVMLSGKERLLKLLPSHIIQIEGKKPMSYKDFMNGYSEGKIILKTLGLLS